MPATITDKPHAGRVALVTGAARGIGQAIAVGLAERGATVVVSGLGDLTGTSKLIAEIGTPAMAMSLDISSPASVDGVREQVARELGRVDILVNNAAIFESATWNWAAETGGHALRIIYGGVFDRHPGAEVAGLQATDQRPGSILHRRAHGNL